MNRCVMVATDGEPEASGAVRCAGDISRRLRLPLEVITVCEPASVFGYGPVDLVAPVLEEMAEAARNIRRQAVHAQLIDASVVSAAPVSVEIGPSAPTISRVVSKREARLVVVGRRKHGAIDRVLGDETALRLMHASHVPVLSVPDSYVELPNRCLAAVDFTSYSIDAARTALDLLAPGSELHLVHVISDKFPTGGASWRETEWMRAMRETAEARMEALVEEIAAQAPRVHVTAHVVEGRPVHAILHLAEALEVEMLAAGTNGYGFLGRLLMGSVATQLVRRSHCMTLIAPPRGVGMDQSIPDGLRHGSSLAKELLAEVGVRAF